MLSSHAEGHFDCTQYIDSNPVYKKALSFKQTVTVVCNGVSIALHLLILLDSAFLSQLGNLYYTVNYHIEITIFTRVMPRTMEMDWNQITKSLLR